MVLVATAEMAEMAETAEAMVEFVLLVAAAVKEERAVMDKKALMEFPTRLLQ